MSKREGKHIMRIVEKYALPPYDPNSDDMTVPFAIELAEKDREIARLQLANKQSMAQADLRSRENVGLRAALQCIVSNKNNRNWRKPELVAEAERALEQEAREAK